MSFICSHRERVFSRAIDPASGTGLDDQSKATALCTGIGLEYRIDLATSSETKNPGCAE